MRLLNRIPSWLKNKYALTVAGFIVWMLFFDDRDLITTHFRHPAALKKLQQSEKYYEEQISVTLRELVQLRSDPAILEKYAREKYLMKRDNEDLFIVRNK